MRTKCYTMKPGYCLEWDGGHGSSWVDSHSEEWDTVTYTPSGLEASCGTRRIDGTPVIVFGCPDGKYRAQTEVMAR